MFCYHVYIIKRLMATLRNVTVTYSTPNTPTSTATPRGEHSKHL